MSVKAMQIDLLLAGLTDTNGDALDSGKIYTYEAGTTTPKATYQDQARATPHANPIVLDSYGRALAFGDGFYKFVVKDSSDTTLYTWDYLNYSGGLFVEQSGSEYVVKYEDEDDTERQVTSRVGVLVHKAADQAFAASGQIQFDTEVTDPLSEFNTASYEFTAKYTGTYLIGCDVELASVADGKWVELYTQGDLTTQIRRLVTSPGGLYCRAAMTTVEELTAGDQISFHLASDDTNWVLRGGRGYSRAWFTRLF